MTDITPERRRELEHERIGARFLRTARRRHWWSRSMEYSYEFVGWDNDARAAAGLPPRHDIPGDPS